MSVHRVTLLSALGVVCLIIAAKSGFATTAVIPNDRTMAVESRAIVTGQVLEVSSAVGSNDLVYTYIKVAVEECLKGEINEAQIILRELGGESAGRGTLLFGLPRFEVGQQVFLYLDTWQDGALRVRHGFIGKFDVGADSSGRLVATRQQEGADVTVVPNTPGFTTTTAELNSYRTQIRNLVDANREASMDFEHRYYSRVPMLTRPSEYESVTRSSGITPMWAVANPSAPTRWFEADSGQPVMFYINVANAPSSQIVDDMVSAMNAWSPAAGSSIKLRYGGETSGFGVQQTDGKNTISFNNGDGYFSPSSACDGLLAVSGIIRYSTSQMKQVGGRNFAKAVEANVSFNPSMFCWFTNRCQIQEVATHELGHGIGLGHSGSSDAVMYAHAHFDNRCASLTDDDRAGVAAIYPTSISGGSPTIVTGSDLSIGRINVTYGVQLEASGGAGSYAWSICQGNPGAGLVLAPSGFLFGTPGGSGDFHFTARVRDASGNVAERSMVLVVQSPPPAPVVSNAEYRKKRVTVSGVNFEEGSNVFIDDERVPASFSAGALITKKRPISQGIHAIYVVNYDGKRSDRFTFSVE